MGYWAKPPKCRFTPPLWNILVKNEGVQTGRTNVQDTTDVSAGVSEPPHHDTQQHVVTAIIISSITASSFQTNVFRQTFLQHCSDICLQLSANICSELWLSDII